MIFTILCIIAALFLGGIVYTLIWDKWVSENCILYGLAVVINLFLAVLFGMDINLGEKVYTGYIYSASDIVNKTSVEIRFSEYAGEDSQPSFCVKKEDGSFLKELAGSGTKVRVVIPEGFKINDFWNCGLPAKVEILEVNNE